MRLIAALPLVFLTTQACIGAETPPAAESEVTPPDMTGPEGSCNANAFNGIIGQNVNTILVEAIEGPVRVIRPGQMITMDFRANRLNIELDEIGKVARVWCG